MRFPPGERRANLNVPAIATAPGGVSRRPAVLPMDETQVHEVRRRRARFIGMHHPDRGGNPDVFIAGLRAFDRELRQDTEPPPRVIVVKRRPWLARQAVAAAQRLRHGSRPPRVQ